MSEALPTEQSDLPRCPKCGRVRHLRAGEQAGQALADAVAMLAGQPRMPYLLSTYRSEDRVVIQCENEERAEEALKRVMSWLHEMHAEDRP